MLSNQPGVEGKQTPAHSLSHTHQHKELQHDLTLHRLKLQILGLWLFLLFHSCDTLVYNNNKTHQSLPQVIERVVCHVLRRKLSHGWQCVAGSFHLLTSVFQTRPWLTASSFEPTWLNASHGVPPTAEVFEAQWGGLKRAISVLWCQFTAAADSSVQTWFMLLWRKQSPPSPPVGPVQ